MRKIILTVGILCALLVSNLAFCADYKAILDEFNLTLVQKAKLLKIKTEEQNEIEPLKTNLIQKQKALLSAQNINCAPFDFICSARKQKKISTSKKEIDRAKEALRRTKSYYINLYLDVLDERQKLIFDEILHDTVSEYAKKVFEQGL